MNKKVLLFSVLLAGSILSSSAQNGFENSDQNVEMQPKGSLNTYKTTWKKNRFKDNWVISIGAGAQMLNGEDDSKADFAKRLTVAPKFSIGKYFSPIWGLRLSVTGGGLHGYNDGRAGTYTYWNKKGYHGGIQMTVDPVWAFNNWIEIIDGKPYMTDGTPITSSTNPIYLEDGEYVWRPGNKANGGKLYQQKIHYVGASVDFMFDLINLVGNYNPKRFFEITPFAGIGFYQRLANQGVLAGSFAGVNAGLNFKFRLSERFNFNIEGNGIYLPSSFDGQEGNKIGADGVLQATAGFSYKLGKTSWDVSEPMDYELIDGLNSRINDLQNELVNKECPECPECPTVEIIEQKTEDFKFLPDPVFFKIDKASIDASEWSKIDKAASYLKNHPEANVVVTGYADKNTAYPAYNMKLSERRAKTVAKALVDKYGVSPSKISINWEGDKTQPFKVNEWNRVVIFVIE